VLLLAAAQVSADSPPAAPSVQKVFSTNKRFFVRLDPASKTATVFKSAATPAKQWEMPAEFSIGFLSNDGRFLVAVYRGGNLVPIEHSPDEVMLTFFDRGKLVAQIRLNQLIETKELARTASHYRWANSFGFESDHRFRVETSDRRTHVYDVTTGERVFAERKKGR
jgi:hypothetical protein